ncbi:hypothetical protein SPRA44_590020 [Serratia proteamaculans]|nr:hypothetical protein SPRA44_590020 [Serratia proteamaculans]
MLSMSKSPLSNGVVYRIKALLRLLPIVCVKTSVKAYPQWGETVYTVGQNPTG